MAEPWKPDDDEMQPRAFGRPLTEDERAEYDEWRTRRREKGEANYLGMPGYRPAQACVKCGFADRPARTAFCPSGEQNACFELSGPHEHLHRSCRRCNYVWLERPLSDEA